MMILFMLFLYRFDGLQTQAPGLKHPIQPAL